MNIKTMINKGLTIVTTSLLLLNSTTMITSAQEKSDAFIADREITGLIFQSAGDAGVDSMSPEIAKYIKDRTGITLTLTTVTAEDSTQALAAGLAAGDLPDFISFYLNNSGRPEFPLLLSASNQGMFHDIAPFLKEGENYGKYFEEGYLPRDTKENIMMREDQNGATYLVHMSINEKPADPGNKTIGGPYIRKDIVDKLGIDPKSITTTEQLQDLLKQIAEGGFTDNNGNPVMPLGPTVWGGSERPFIYNDLVWSGAGGEKFWKEGETIKHESMTDYAEKRVAFVRQLMAEGLMHPEFYTMEETRAQEGVVNGSFAIVADMHNYRPEVGTAEELKYVPLGPINRVDGKNHMVMPYKSGYAGWAIPATTENPEEIVKFADWLAGPEGKMLYFYGLEGEHYTIGEDGKPMPNPDLVKLQAEKPDEALKEGFRGVRAWWGEHLAYTNMNNMDQFGEAAWGDKVRGAEGETASAAQQIIDYANFDERYEDKEVIDGLFARAYLYEYAGEDTKLTEALDGWDEDIVKAYYATSDEEAQAIIDAARQDLIDAGIEEYCQFLQEKEANGDVIFY
ncbi:extracellular solute-binding protein [Facklamia miroungae]|uniref:Putative aldouronate transport system substrate-binding protein n=1 Tax=Facklamia miroungae TaxID=120956 RepID=A0A1G7Q9H0_9LACT|nr:extracellular solute-binding protein [Facklamia miroungae]NKZ28870.1 extracellular solute-binding protein [Facklamia miroungae]SDF95191.1 putative aldouronate transport system substrate-binding protein [Facklamia miroungae]